MRYGKVIHQAVGKAKEMTQEIALHGFTTRVRLAEEELELAHIDRMHLKLALKDGTFLLLQPAIEALAARDQRYVKLYAGDTVEVSFDPPKWLDAEDVAGTSVIVTGYYERYSALQLSRR